MKLTAEGDWLILHAPTYPTRLTSWLKYTLKPPEWRYFDGKRKSWFVHSSKINDLAKYLTSLGIKVEYSDLPSGWQVLFIEKEADWWGVLHLREGAPKEVIQGAWRALVRLHHPDLGGDGDKVAEVNRAYTELMRRVK